MPLSLDEFRRRLEASRLLSAGELAALDVSSHTAAALAQQLVAQELLTKFQAETLLGDHPRPLVLDEYVLLAPLGAGGMGEVFQARHRRMDRLVALKMLPSKTIASPEAVARFHREVKAASRLSHPNIVAVFDAREDHGTHFYVMEYVAGEDLSSVLKTRGKLPIPYAVEVIRQAAAGLAYAHEHGVIHRDVKPANILLAHENPSSAARKRESGIHSSPGDSRKSKGDRSTVKILDLGLARIEHADDPRIHETNDALTSSGQVMGTADYMAPEQAEDTRAADHRSDIYSLGCTLFRLVTGQAPFAGDTALRKILAHREHAVPSLAALREGTPPALDELCRRMMAKRPTDRPQSMDDVAEALAEVLSLSAANSTTGLTDPSMIALGSEAQADYKQADALPRPSLVAPHPAPLVAPAEPPSHTAAGQELSDTTSTKVKQLAVPAAATSLADLERRRIAADRRTQRWVIAGGVLSLLVLAGGIALIAWFSTPRVPQGTLIVEGPHDKVTIAAQHEDRERSDVLTFDREGRATLRPGRYELGLLKGSGVYALTPTRVDITDRGELRVQLKARVPDDVPPIDSPSVGGESTPVEYALQFDGDAYVETPITYDGTHPLTIEAWVTLAGAGREGTNHLCSNWKDTGVSFQDIQGRWEFGIGDGRRDAGTHYRVLAEQAGPLMQRVHLAGVCDGDQVWLFINGIPQGSPAAIKQPALASSQPFFIGGYDHTGSLQGRISAVRMSSNVRYREKFTPPARLNPDANTLALYRFDEGQGDIAHDSSGNGHDAKIVNAAWTYAEGVLPGLINLPARVPGLTSWQIARSWSRGAYAQFSPDGRWLAQVGSGGVRVYEAKTWRLQGVLPSRASRVAWHPDNRTLAVGDGDRTITMWDVVTREPGPVLRGHASWINALAWNHAGDRLASAPHWLDPTVRIWNRDGQLLQTLNVGDGAKVGVSWNPDGKQIAVNVGASVQVWQLSDEPKRLFTLPESGQPAWHPGRLAIACASGGHHQPDVPKAKIFDATNGILEQEISLQASVHGANAVAWNRIGNLLAFGTQSVQVGVWDRAANKIAFHANAEESVYSVTWASDEKVLSGTHSQLKIWDTAGGEAQEIGRFAPRVQALALPRADGPLCIAAEDGLLRLVDVNARSTTKLENDGGVALRQMVVSHDGQWAAGIDATGKGIVWNIPQKRVTREILLEGDPLTTLAFAPHDWSLAAGTESGKLLMFAMGRNESLFTIPDLGPLRWLAWSGDGKQLGVVNAEREVRLLNGADGSLFSTLAEKHAHAIAFSPGERWLAGIDWESKQLWVLDAKTWKDSRFFLAPGELQYGRIAWSGDGTRFAATRHDGHVDIWTAGGERRVLKVRAHELAWGPSDAWLACSEDEGRVTLRDPKSGDLLWQVLTLPDGQTATLDRNGRLLDGEPAAVDKDLKYLIEQKDGRINLHTHSEFLQLIGGNFPEIHVETSTSTLQPRLGGHYALEFDGKSAFVVAEFPKRELVEATVEAWITPHNDKDLNVLRVIEPSDKIRDDVVQIVTFVESKVCAVHWRRRDGTEDVYGVHPIQNRQQIHVAWTLTNGTVRFFVNGVAVAAPWDAKLRTMPSRLEIGNVNDAAVRYSGHIDEVRISSTARYDADFKPDRRFEADEHTFVVYHFDEGQGDVLIDSSGNGHHGKIHGAKWVRAADPLKSP